MNDDEWTYKGFLCLIEIDCDDSSAKAYHSVSGPTCTGITHCLDISPYDHSRESVEKWIDENLLKGNQ